MSRKEGHLGHPAVQQALKKRERLVKEQLDHDLRRITGEEWGRRWMYRLLYGLCGLETESAHASGSTTYFNEGRRAVAIELKRTLHRVCPADFVHMVQEAVSAQQHEELSRDRAVASAEATDGDGHSWPGDE